MKSYICLALFKHYITQLINHLTSTARLGHQVIRFFGFPKVWIAMTGGVIILVAGIFYEAVTSRNQAYYFAKIGRDCSFSPADGVSSNIRFPVYGPYDQRLGYCNIPQFSQALSRIGFVVHSQSIISRKMADIFDEGYNLPYREKQQAGISVLDQRGRIMYKSAFPLWAYPSFDSIPPLVVQTLLAIEDQQLLDTLHPYRNPAIDWSRISSSVFSFGVSKFGIKQRVNGGSTLATQIEKYRHSPDGRTIDPLEKVRQMKSAILRTYYHGEKTIDMRKNIVLDYINTAPLGAFPGYGEIHGLGEGLFFWYGINIDSVNTALSAYNEVPLMMQARYYRMILGLLFAHRRPSYYLVSNPSALNEKTDNFLRILQKRKIISDTLCNAALTCNLQFNRPATFNAQIQGLPLLHKSANSVIDPLLGILELPSKYDLTHLDCTVRCGLDSAATATVIEFFQCLKSPHFLDSLGLRGHRMLNKGNPADVIYSMSLFARKDSVNVLRIQADSYNAPLNFNSGVRLDLGSTAKLRTLVTYLEIIEVLHHQFTVLNRNALSAYPASDPLTLWAKSYLLSATDTALGVMLESSLERTYSASPTEGFFTGSDLHHFQNFNSDDDTRTISLREAFKFSINLVFIRLMKDIVAYHIIKIPAATELALNTGKAPWKIYLDRFVRYESSVFLSKFYQQMKNIPPAAMADTLVAEIKSTKDRLASIYCSTAKNPTPYGLQCFLQHHGVTDTSQHSNMRLFNQSNGFSWSDKGYSSRIHPLKLWAASYLVRNPGAKLHDLENAIRPDLDNMYRWLYSKDRAEFQRSRIQIMLEMDAFVHIFHSWQKQGYPFAEITPSLATAIGASADRPASLAHLMGIIQNDGLLLPTRQIEQVQFGTGTPYETVLDKTDLPNKRILSLQVARSVRTCMIDVVEGGTAIRAAKTFNSSMIVGGKTGTGDHRQLIFGPDGIKIKEIYIERSATFVFFIGDCYFGVLTVTVLGPDAKDYEFTSSYPVQLFACLVPELVSLIAPDGHVMRSKNHI